MYPTYTFSNIYYKLVLNKMHVCDLMFVWIPFILLKLKTYC